MGWKLATSYTPVSRPSTTLGMEEILLFKDLEVPAACESALALALDLQPSSSLRTTSVAVVNANRGHSF